MLEILAYSSETPVSTAPPWLGRASCCTQSIFSLISIKQQPPTLILRELEGSFAEDLCNMRFFKLQYILVLAKFSFFFCTEPSWDAAGGAPKQAAARQVGPLCQALVLLQLLCLHHTHHHPYCSCLLQTCTEEWKGALLLSCVRGTTHCMISQIYLPFECVALASKFSPFLKAGERSDPARFPVLPLCCSTLRNLTTPCSPRNGVASSCWQGQVFSTSSSAE